MGGNDLDQRFFATVDRVREHGGAAWWLYLSRCTACGQDWMIAQEERVFDDYFVKRLRRTDAELIIEVGRWPDEFITYERMLGIGHILSRPCVFLDRLDFSLGWAAKDLRLERPEIGEDEIAALLAVPADHVGKLLAIETSS